MRYLGNSSKCATLKVPRTEYSPLQGFSAGYSADDANVRLWKLVEPLVPAFTRRGWKPEFRLYCTGIIWIKTKYLLDHLVIMPGLRESLPDLANPPLACRSRSFGVIRLIALRLVTLRVVVIRLIVASFNGTTQESVVSNVISDVQGGGVTDKALPRKVVGPRFLLLSRT